MTKRSPDKIQSLRILRDRGVPVGTIVDVGVCHCTAELMAVWPDIKHMLFEPVSEFESAIERHYRNISHELHKVAVSDENGTISLKVASVLPGMDISHSGMTTVKSGTADPSVRTVPMIKLDDFLNDRELECPYLLKVDIDGQELKVLRGATETLKKCSIVIVECQSSQLVQLISVVQAAGFTLFDLAEPCYYDKVFWQCDAVFLRNDIAASRFKKLSGQVGQGMYEAYRGS